MRQLTASQKIAILENKVAQLEKQAMFNKIRSLFSRLKPLKEASRALEDLGLKPQELMRKQSKVSMTKMYRQLDKSLRGKSHEQKIKTLSGMLMDRDNLEVLESKYGVKYLGPSKQASVTLALGMATPEEFIIGLGLCLGLILIGTCSAYLADVVKDLISKVDRNLLGKGFLSNLTGSWALLVLKILYYPLKGISTLAKAIASMIGQGIS